MKEEGVLSKNTKPLGVNFGHLLVWQLLVTSKHLADFLAVNSTGVVWLSCEQLIAHDTEREDIDGGVRSVGALATLECCHGFWCSVTQCEANRYL